MRTLVKYLLAITFLLTQEVQAASIPITYSASYSPSDSSVKKNILINPSIVAPLKKVGFIKKVQIKLIQKQLQRFARHHFDEGDAPRKNVLSTISLILGIVALISLFIPAIGGIALIAALAALITGIIALGKHYNNSKASRTKAIFGVVLGSVILFLFLIAIILIASSGWGWVVFAGI